MGHVATRAFLAGAARRPDDGSACSDSGNAIAARTGRNNATRVACNPRAGGGDPLARADAYGSITKLVATNVSPLVFPDTRALRIAWHTPVL